MPNRDIFCYIFVARENLVFVLPMREMEVVRYCRQLILQFGIKFYQMDFIRICTARGGSEMSTRLSIFN